MKISYLLPLFAIVAPAFATDNELNAEEKSADWQLLFDGKDAAANFRGYKKDKLPDGWVAKGLPAVRCGRQRTALMSWSRIQWGNN